MYLYRCYTFIGLWSNKVLKNDNLLLVLQTNIWYQWYRLRSNRNSEFAPTEFASSVNFVISSLPLPLSSSPQTFVFIKNTCYSLY